MLHNTSIIAGIFRLQKQSSPISRIRDVVRHVAVTFIHIPFLFLSAIVSLSSLQAQPGGEALLQHATVNSYIVKEIGNPIILMAKDIDRPVSPASLTKILTCIMAIESGRLEQDVVITKESTLVEPSKAGFGEGDRIKLIDLVRAAMVSSSNDAAFAIGIYLSGNVESFVASMNQKAKAIGMKNSLFTNPAGFDKGVYAGNSSTAADLMRLTEYSVRNPVFNQIARLEKVAVSEQTGKKVYWLKTHNKLLDKYQYAVGIKTGYTCKAGGCLIARAVKDNKDILLVMLNARNRWDIASGMFDTAFAANGVPVITPVVSSSENAIATRSQLVPKQKRTSVAAMSKVGIRSPKSRKVMVAALKSSRRAHKPEVAGVKSAHKTKKQMIAGLKSSRKSQKHLLADASSGKKFKRQHLASSKPIKKNKKRTSLS